MSNYERVLERMLEENGFELLPGRKHLVYRSARLGGRIFVTAATASDNYRAVKNMISELQKVINNPSRSEIESIEAFAKAQAATIGLQATVKAQQGQRARSSSSRGTGFTYYHPDDRLSSEEKRLKREAHEAEVVMRQVAREQDKKDEVLVREILKPWVPILEFGEVENFETKTLEPLHLKRLKFEHCRIKGVFITDVFSAERVEVGVRVYFNSVFYADGKSTMEHVKYHDGDQDFNVVFYPDGKETRERVRFRDGMQNFNSVTHPSGKETAERVEFPSGEKHFNIVWYLNGSKHVERIIGPDGDRMFNVKFHTDGRQTAKRSESPDGSTRSFNIVVYHEDRATTERTQLADGTVKYGGLITKEGTETWERMTCPDGTVKYNGVVADDGTVTWEREEAPAA